MKSSIIKLLLASVLCIISWTPVQSETKATIHTFDIDIPSNDVIDSWTYELENNLVDSTINIKQDCPESIELEIQVFQENEVVSQVFKELDKPMKNFEDYGICGMLDYTEPDEDSCSILQGEQKCKDCDISDLMKDLSPGDYNIKSDFKQNGNVIASIVMSVTVEESGV